MIYRYSTEEKNGKPYITGWASEKGEPDNIETFAEPCDMEEPWQYVLEAQPNGKFKKIHDPLPKTPEELAEEHRLKVNQEIQEKLPDLIRIIALDDTKGFEELKAEIKAIDQSVEVRSATKA